MCCLFRLASLILQYALKFPTFFFHGLVAFFFFPEVLNNIPRCGWMYHNLCIQLLKDAGGFEVLTIVSKAVVYISMQVLVGQKFSAHLGEYQAAGMLDLCSVLLMLLLPLLFD